MQGVFLANVNFPSWSGTATTAEMTQKITHKYPRSVPTAPAFTLSHLALVIPSRNCSIFFHFQTLLAACAWALTNILFPLSKSLLSPFFFSLIYLLCLSFSPSPFPSLYLFFFLLFFSFSPPVVTSSLFVISPPSISLQLINKPGEQQ